MNEVFILDKEFLFKNNVYEITSISLEHNYDVNGSDCTGEFVISGDYRLHEVSINKEDFSFRIPFNNAVKSNVNLDSIEVEITDFTYELEEDVLKVHVEYQVSGEQSLIEFAEEEDLEDFLQKNKAEIVDLSEDERQEEAPLFEEAPQIIEESPKTENLDTQEVISPENRENIDKIIDQSSIINSINSEESFITYHVHSVTSSDTLESICTTYNINLNDLKKLNTFDELAVNMKLIIPDEEN